MLALLIRLLLLAALVPGPQTASAQDLTGVRSDRPYRGLFGANSADFEDLIVATGSLSGGWDDSAVATTVGTGRPGVTSPSIDSSRSYGMAAGVLTYSTHKKRLDIVASATESDQYVPSLSTPLLTSRGFRADVGSQLSRRIRFSASHSSVFQPYKVVLPGFTLVETSQPGTFLLEPAFALQRGQYVIRSSSLSLSRDFAKRTSVNAYYSLQDTHSGGGQSDATISSSGFRVTQGLTKSLSAHLGYGFINARLTSARVQHPFQVHQLDFGIDFLKNLALDRRTAVSFSTGSYLMTSGIQGNYFGLTADARITRELGRSWATSLVYRRGVQFVEAFTAPFFVDSASLSLNGLISRRLQFHSSASSTIGQIGVSSFDSSFRSYSGIAGASMAVSRNWSIGADYLLYNFDLRRYQQIPAGLDRTTWRQGARVTLSAWVPILERMKKGNASK